MAMTWQKSRPYHGIRENIRSSETVRKVFKKLERMQISAEKLNVPQSAQYSEPFEASPQYQIEPRLDWFKF
jgi:hypothetical protein